VLYADASECEIYGNTCNVNGGGAAGSILRNCLIRNNAVNQEGGGAYLSSLKNCTVVYNGAKNGGGVSGGTQENCIVYFNTATTGSNYWTSDMRYSCTTPDLGVQGCFAADPMFVDVSSRNYRLRYGSPCIDRGTNNTESVPLDLDHYARPLDGDFNGQSRYDVGAYEYNPSVYDTDGDGMPDRWEFGHGLNPSSSNGIDGAAADWDGDGMDNFAEWVADTDPTNNASFLHFTDIEFSGNGISLGWQGGTSVWQYLERSTRMGTGTVWTSVFSNGPVTAPSTSYLDTAATNSAYFYRIKAAR
jgi:hypothetical protein